MNCIEIHEFRCNTEKKLRREIKRWWNAHMHDIAYCNTKLDHLGRATGQDFKHMRLYYLI